MKNYASKLTEYTKLTHYIKCLLDYFKIMHEN